MSTTVYGVPYARVTCGTCHETLVCAQVYFGWICFGCATRLPDWNELPETVRQRAHADFVTATKMLIDGIAIERMFAPRDIAWFESLT